MKISFALNIYLNPIGFRSSKLEHEFHNCTINNVHSIQKKIDDINFIS